jgi:AsmA protein
MIARIETRSVTTMRVGKILGIVIGAIIAVVAVALLAVRLFVNPNDYKSRIAAAVKQSTGRDLALDGDLKLSVFPWVGLELGRARLGNLAGFGPAPLVSLQSATLRVRLLPLLARHLDVGRIEIDGLALNLQRNAAGRGNWQGSAETTAPAAPGAAPAAGGRSIDLEGLAGVVLKNASVTYDQSTLENIDLEVGRVAETAPHRYHVAPVEFSGALQRPGTGHDVTFKLAAPTVDVDLAAQTLSLPALTSDVAGAQLSGHLQGTHILDAPAFGGAIMLAPLGLRAFMDRLGITAPQTRDPAALTELSGSADFAYGGGALKLEKVAIALDQTQLHGELSLASGDKSALSFDLAVDHLNVDHYLSLAKKPVPPPAPAAGSQPAPTSALRTLTADGTLTVGTLIAGGIDFTSLSVTLHAKDGIARLFPAKAQLYGGAYSGDVTVDSRTDTPALTLDQHLSNIDVGRLLADSLKSHRLAGRGNFSLQATAHGSDADSVLKTLSGHAETNLADGALEGVDLWYEVSAAQALLKHQAPLAADTAKRTKFDAVKLSATIDRGVATTKDLTIASGLLRVTGEGSANLVTEGIDFHIVATLLNEARTASSADIPIAITGTIASPTVRPDVQGLLKGQLRQKLQNALGDKLGDKLKGLLGQ